MMFKYLYFVVVFSSVVFVGCGSSGNTGNQTDDYEIRVTEEIVFIDHYKAHCTTGPDGFCMRINYANEQVWNAEVYYIEGFQFTWGHRYKLRIRKEQDTNPYIDGGGVDYFLLEILEEEVMQANSLFQVHIESSFPLIKVSGQSYKYDARDVICEPEVCSVLDALQEQDVDILMEMKYQDTIEEPLVLTQIICSAQGGRIFYQDCLNE